MKESILKYVFTLILSVTLGNLFAQEITIYRLSSSENCTTGYLSVNGDIVCYTLELPWRDNAGFISCIPKGTYDANIRYDKKDRWRIQLIGVPNRGGVQIHIGNFTKEIQGCVLVGTSVSLNGCSVDSSKVAYEKMKTACYFSDGQNLKVSFQ